MFHANTTKLIEEWRTRRVGRALPARTDISPVQFGALLPQIFILGQEDDGAEVFRLAGGLLADLHGRELRGADFFTLWARPVRDQVRAALAEARSAGTPVVLHAGAVTEEGDEIGIEIVLAPLMGAAGAADRTIGLYQPVSTVARLMGRSVQSLTWRGAKLADAVAPRPAYLKLVAIEGRRVA